MPSRVERPVLLVRPGSCMIFQRKCQCFFFICGCRRSPFLTTSSLVFISFQFDASTPRPTDVRWVQCFDGESTADSAPWKRISKGDFHVANVQFTVVGNVAVEQQRSLTMLGVPPNDACARRSASGPSVGCRHGHCEGDVPACETSKMSCRDGVAKWRSGGNVSIRVGLPALA